jgi:hypothetical protein
MELSTNKMADFVRCTIRYLFTAIVFPAGGTGPCNVIRENYFHTIV